MVDFSKEINKTGTGLGLYISKKLSMRLCPPNYKGIKVISKLGEGSKFSLIIDDK